MISQEKQEQEGLKSAKENEARARKKQKNKNRNNAVRQWVKKAVIGLSIKAGILLGGTMLVFTIVGEAIDLFDGGGGNGYGNGYIIAGEDDYIVHIDKSPSEIVINDVETLKKAFKGYSGNEKLIEYADVFLEYQNTYKVNAVFAAAVSITETSAGRNGNATNGKNAWFNIECTCGDSSHGRFETYSSLKESIEAFYKLIANGSYYFTKGNYTVRTIGLAGYCEDAEVVWIPDTISFMTKMYNSAGITIVPKGTAVFSMTNGIDIYNSDGTVNQEEISRLNNYLTKDVLNTTIHKSGQNQNGAFQKWWTSSCTALEKFQCTWWAYGRASQYLELTGNSTYSKYPTKPDGKSGNGGEWYDVNEQYGWFNYGKTPKANSIISWKQGEFGHVAYVEAVDSTGIWISHAALGKAWYGIEKIPLNGTLPWAGYTLNGYIYLDSPK